ncbi:hypothetical protein A2U01_0111791, partial [Trifolium medium]|nr:hypothetical protein [Trifolium medium]
MIAQRAYQQAWSLSVTAARNFQ